ncbi:MAG: PH domain-containing protein [Thaumarchaeota archaeon]|nr:PH domain-containing protein [Nitrososphaerota archaeon]
MAQAPAGIALEKGERVEWVGRMSYKANLGLLILGILTVWLFLLGLFFLVLVYLRVKSTHYALTNRKVYSKYGLIGRRVTESPISWVTDIQVNQGFLARFLSIGTLRINTPGSAGYEIVFLGISDPMNVRARIAALTQGLKNATELRDKIKRLDEEYELGRIDATRFASLKAKYQQDLAKYEAQT